jgi:hypothetical protein
VEVVALTEQQFLSGQHLRLLAVVALLALKPT